MKIRHALFVAAILALYGLWIVGLLAAAIWFFAFLSAGSVLLALATFFAGWVWFCGGIFVMVVTDK